MKNCAWMSALCVSILAIGSVAECSVAFHGSESIFRTSTTVVSTETFDHFPRPYPYRFYTMQIEIDRVLYETDKRLPDPQQSVWHLNDTGYWGTVSAPAYLVSNAIGRHTISFGQGNRVGAIGFWFLSWTGDWQVSVVEADGNASLFEFSHPLPVQYDPEYWGFSSGVGITSLAVNAVDRGHGGAANWAYDNVSRSEIFVPEPSSMLALMLGVVGTYGLARRRKR